MPLQGSKLSNFKTSSIFEQFLVTKIQIFSFREEKCLPVMTKASVLSEKYVPLLLYRIDQKTSLAVRQTCFNWKLLLILLYKFNNQNNGLRFFLTPHSISFFNFHTLIFIDKSHEAYLIPALAQPSNYNLFVVFILLQTGKFLSFIHFFYLLY